MGLAFVARAPQKIDQSKPNRRVNVQNVRSSSAKLNDNRNVCE
jgi:hypothetical protein